MQDYSLPDKTSPDGTIRVEFEVSTGLMSHEIYSPRVLSLPSGEVLADLWGMQWDASAKFEAAGTVTLALRHYGSEKPGFGVTLDARTRSFFFTDSPGESHALDHFVKLIKRKLKAQKPYPSSVPAADAWTLRRFLETIFYTLLMLVIVSAPAWLFGLFKLLR